MKDKLKEVEKNIKELVDKADLEIEEQIDKYYNGAGYSHNVISLILSNLAKKVGTHYANDLVRKHELEEIFGIPEA